MEYGHKKKNYMEIPEGQGMKSERGEKLGTTANGAPRMLTPKEHFFIFGSKQ